MSTILTFITSPHPTLSPTTSLDPRKSAIDRSGWPTASDFTSEERVKIFWTRAHWIAFECKRKGISAPLLEANNDSLTGSDNTDVAGNARQGKGRAEEGINVKM